MIWPAKSTDENVTYKCKGNEFTHGAILAASGGYASIGTTIRITLAPGAIGILLTVSKLISASKRDKLEYRVAARLLGSELDAVTPALSVEALALAAPADRSIQYVELTPVKANVQIRVTAVDVWCNPESTSAFHPVSLRDDIQQLKAQAAANASAASSSAAALDPNASSAAALDLKAIEKLLAETHAAAERKAAEAIALAKTEAAAEAKRLAAEYALSKDVAELEAGLFPAQPSSMCSFHRRSS
jgi:hypothetical protein